MKIISFTLIAMLIAAFVPLQSQAQFNTCCPYIGAIDIIPNNPTTSDPIKIATMVSSPTLGQFISKSHTVSQDTIYLESCYYAGFLTAIQVYEDTFDIGVLPAGNYTVILTAHLSDSVESCSSYDFSTVDTSFTVIESTNELPMHLIEEIQVYPNPSNGEFMLDMGESVDITHIEITALDGKLIQRMPFAFKTRIELSSGMYLIHFYHQHEFLGIKRVIIE